MGFKPSGYVQISKIDVNKLEGGTLKTVVTLKNLGTEPVQSPSLNVSYRERNTGKIIEKLHQNRRL